MNAESTPQDRRFGLSPDELSYWNENGYLVRLDVFTAEENDVLRRVAEDVVDKKRPFPATNVNQNALVRDGKVEEQGIYAMHKIHTRAVTARNSWHGCAIPASPIHSLTSSAQISSASIIYLSGRHPRSVSVSRGIRTSFTSGTGLTQKLLLGHGRLLTQPIGENGCLYVIPGSHKWDIFQHDDLEGSQQQEFKLARGARDEDGIAVEVPPGAVIWFHSHLLHKSTDNHSLRFRRSYVIHYLSAQRNGRILRHSIAGEDNPSCGFAVRPFPTKFTKSSAMFYSFPNLLDIIKKCLGFKCF